MGIGFTDNDLMLDPNSNVSLYTWCQEKIDPSENARILRGNAGISGATYILSNAQTGALAWRPVLEYIGPAFEDTSGSPGGTKTVARSDKDGFFGEVSADKFISGTTLASQIGLSSGVSQFGTEGWLKFYSEGKILFVAKKPFKYSVSWNQLNGVGAVNGNVVVEINGLYYKVRLLEGLKGSYLTETYNTEWNRLMLPICAKAKNQSWSHIEYAGNNIPYWGINYSETDLHVSYVNGQGAYSWCLGLTATGYASCRGGYYDASFSTSATKESNGGDWGWRPVLELIDRAKDDTSGSPGSPMLVAGDKTTGFFGEVDSTKFINGINLATNIGLATGINHYTGTSWLKFSLDNKILFVAKKPIRHSISWSQLNDVNAISGDRTININGLTYKVRLMRGALTDPAIFSDPDKGAKGSEWNRLMLPIHEQAKTKSWTYLAYVESNVPDWNIGYTDNDLISINAAGNGSYTWCQETSSSSTGNERVIRGYNGISWAHVTDKTASNTSIFGWRPVLELVQ